MTNIKDTNTKDICADTKNLQIQELDNFMWLIGYYRADTAYCCAFSDSKANTIPFNSAVRLYNSGFDMTGDKAGAYGVDKCSLLYALHTRRFYNLKVGTTRHGRDILCFNNWLTLRIPYGVKEEEAEAYIKKLALHAVC